MSDVRVFALQDRWMDKETNEQNGSETLHRSTRYSHGMKNKTALVISLSYESLIFFSFHQFDISAAVHHTLSTAAARCVVQFKLSNIIVANACILK